MSHAHITHSPADLDALLQVHEALRMAGVPDWYDPEGGTGPDAQAKLKEAFCLVVLVSKDAMQSKSVQRDIETALAQGLPDSCHSASMAHGSTVISKTRSCPNSNTLCPKKGGLSRFAQSVKHQYRHRCPVISVMNLKGGVGKTTITAQVFGAWQARTNGRVLLIDFDPQYNLTQTFFQMRVADESSAADRSVISLFERSKVQYPDAPSPAGDWTTLSTKPFTALPRERLMHDLLVDGGPNGWLDLVSGQFELSKYAFVQNAADLEKVKENFLRVIDHYRSLYDLIIFDTNPNATFLTRCALEAADRVLAPIHPDMYSLRGIRLLNRVIHEQVSAEAKPELSVLFNAVRRSEETTFEGDARAGAHDKLVGFDLSNALLNAALPKSGHMVVRAPDEDTDTPLPPWKSLIVHHGRGGGLRAIRESLNTVGMELAELVKQTV